MRRFLTDSDDDRLPDIDDPVLPEDRQPVEDVENETEAEGVSEVNERQASLEDDPDLADMEDNAYDWQPSVWDPPQPGVDEENRHRILPDEDVRQVVGLHCSICRDQLSHAATLTCGHMICINCAENPQLKRCPFCAAALKIKVVSNLGTLELERVDEAPIPVVVPPAPRPAEAPTAAPLPRADHADPPTAQARSATEDRDSDAINAMLREDGIQDVVAYRRQLRRQGRLERGTRRFSRTYGIPDAGNSENYEDEQEDNEGQDDVRQNEQRQAEDPEGNQDDIENRVDPGRHQRRNLVLQAALHRLSQEDPPMNEPRPSTSRGTSGGGEEQQRAVGSQVRNLEEVTQSDDSEAESFVASSQNAGSQVLRRSARAQARRQRALIDGSDDDDGAEIFTQSKRRRRR